MATGSRHERSGKRRALEAAKRGYDINSPKSIFQFAKRLEGHTLREVVGDGLPDWPRPGNKGSFGQYIETHYFGYENNNDSEPDFVEAGVELKTSSLEVRKDGSLGAKERVKLSGINYETLPAESWESCSVMRKNRLLLLIFTVHDSHLSPFDRRIELVQLWEFPPEDLLVAREDWTTIHDTVAAGRASELSEGATNYLGACTSHAGERYKVLPPGKPKPRAFSLKHSYVRTIVGSGLTLHVALRDDDELLEGKGLRAVLEGRFTPFLGWTAQQIANELGVKTVSGSKSYYADITKRILGAREGEAVAELVKAGVIVRTIRMRKNLTPEQDVSFRAFKFTELVSEDWEDSEWRATVESPFFFVVFGPSRHGVFVLRGVRFWSMPESDVDGACRSVWNETIARIKDGRYSELPKKDYVPGGDVCHVRPHGTKGQTYPTPQGGSFSRQCFWLNQLYIKEQVTRFFGD
jgi:DNA mismatch repair protein MutH